MIAHQEIVYTQICGLHNFFLLKFEFDTDLYEF